MNRIRALCLSRNFPNAQFPLLGIWTSRLVAASAGWCETKVISPVPWFPDIAIDRYARYRLIERREVNGDAEVFHPRFFLLPGMTLHSVEATLYYHAIRRQVQQIRSEWPFEIIHAHFIYPDGVVAARLAKEFGVPFLVTEQASWAPWLNNYPTVRRQALAAAGGASKLIAVSRSLATSIASFGIPEKKIAVVPNIVDGSVFNIGERPHSVVPPRILFVGIMRKVKAVDVLLRAFRLLLDSGWDAQLTIVGESFYASYARDYAELRELHTSLALGEKVEFTGALPPSQVAAEMRKSSVVVLPSWRETFGAVLAEALACGTPVVATKCGGPEDIVDGEVGLLVEPGDADALANAIRKVVTHRERYDPQRLSESSLSRFGKDVVGRQLEVLYRAALAERQS
jgi:glycosyltransferase involved in cell wall biosynthesis